MANSPRTMEKSGFGATQRTDAWWLQPVATAAGLGAFVVYSTLRAFENNFYTVGPYLSPFYSPLIDIGMGISPALLILWAPAGFRTTCYYYRKAYYRAFFRDPAACAVGESNEHKYCGETKFPFILQNLHRFMFYVAVIFIFILWHDAYKAFFFEDGVGMGVGTIVMILNATFLSGYTFGCHSFRHLIGGKRDTFQDGNASHGCWMGASKLNAKHMNWAWLSLFWVGFTDFYVRSVASGLFSDFRIF